MGSILPPVTQRRHRLSYQINFDVPLAVILAIVSFVVVRFISTIGAVAKDLKSVTLFLLLQNCRFSLGAMVENLLSHAAKTPPMPKRLLKLAEVRW